MFDPKEFQKIAKSIGSDPQYQSEAGYRTASGRAYYAVYHLVEEWLKRRGWRPKKNKNMHKQMLEELKRQDSHAANLLRALMELRVDSDYRTNVTITRPNADLGMRISDELYSRLVP